MANSQSSSRKHSLKYALLLLAIGSVASPILLGGTHAVAEMEVFVEPAKAPDTQVLEDKVKELKSQWEAEEKRGKPSRHLHLQAERIRDELCKRGKPRYCPAYANIPEAQNVDIEILAHAVAIAESSGCTKGNSALEHNNCFGIKNKNGKFRTFASHEESYLAFQELWLRKYCDCFPTVAMAARYSGGEGTSWLNRVTIAYNRIQARQQAEL